MTTRQLLQDLKSENARLRNEVAGLKKQQEWQPIETAPEETLFECLIGRQGNSNNISAVYICHYVGGDWLAVGTLKKFVSPTHWKPIQPPKEGE